ncbi:MAG: arabinosyltransferase, partial [Nocardia sp.]|nr:arabinosyltransferase [Nocardia sp.]
MLAIAAPLLPVRQDRTSLDWPQAGAASVEAPLVSYQPLRLDLTVPCPVLSGAEGTVVETVPDGSGQSSARGLRVTVTGDTLSVVLRDVPLLAADRAELGGCTALTVTSSALASTAELTGTARADGTPFRAEVGRDIRPQLVGVFTDLPEAQLGGIRLHADIESRFTSSPTPLKIAAIIGAV